MSFDLTETDSDDEDAALAILLAVHRRKQARERRHSPADVYARILNHFERRGQRLRGEQLMTSELMERLFLGHRPLSPGPAQQELAIQGDPGDTAVGRFRVANRSDAPASFELVVGEPMQAGPPVTLSFDPPGGSIAAGHVCLVRVEARLAGWRRGDSTTLPVEVRWPAGRDRLWLVVSTLPAGEDGR